MDYLRNAPGRLDLLPDSKFSILKYDPGTWIHLQTSPWKVPSKPGILSSREGIGERRGTGKMMKTTRYCNQIINNKNYKIYINSESFVRAW